MIVFYSVPGTRSTWELELMEDATNRGWGREVERHGGTVRRIEQLLAELSEPIEETTPAA